VSTKNAVIHGPIRKSFVVRLGEVRITAGGCWEWTGYINPAGYGQSCYKGKCMGAHRASWLHHKGSIPDGFEVDHLCKNTLCVNPLHLEPVLPKINNLRSDSPAAKASRKTHCVHGHPFDNENTIIVNRKGGKTDRRCRACYYRQQRRIWRKRHGWEDHRDGA
jgi:hypothetical protein